MTIVKQDQPGEIGTHALVIGVGRYPHLKGGEGVEFAAHEEMGQLDSPPFSAAQFSEWLLKSYRNPRRPLRSLDVLISGPDANYPALGDVEIEPATLQNIEQAVGRWHASGNLHEDNLLIFFFCGHGVSSGEEQSLLTQHFGRNVLSPFEDAVSFGDFLVGMRGCKAAQQIYFVDACRTVSEEYLQRYNFTGKPIVDGVPHRNLGKTRQPVISASELGAPAYGATNKASFFTCALLRALEGAGCIELDYGWAACSDSLADGINAYLNRLLARAHGLEQVALQTNPSRRVELHYLTNSPLVPVDVGCRPDEFTPVAELSCAKGGQTVKQRSADGGTVWEVELTPGEYEFRARFGDNRCTPQPKTRIVYPPQSRICLDCP